MVTIFRIADANGSKWSAYYLMRQPEVDPLRSFDPV
jgi:hypothetical protein